MERGKDEGRARKKHGERVGRERTGLKGGEGGEVMEKSIKKKKKKKVLHGKREVEGANASLGPAVSSRYCFSAGVSNPEGELHRIPQGGGMMYAGT